ncbi:MAG TPA: hypothetical protein PKA00_06585 [Saprospiraceae bacterium]|nr:hypothetical protein [Saprospiraceae bacterium]HMQ82553.1 hypothetical protein [Saprospiraceae bacterium]
MKMLSIYASSNYLDQINTIIRGESRLHELVQVIDYLEERPLPSFHSLLVKQDAIWPVLDWYNESPPFLLPQNAPFNRANLLGLVYAKLNNFEKTQEQLGAENPIWNAELDFINRLQQSIPIEPEELISDYSPFDEYRLMHNQAVVRHYAPSLAEEELDKIKYFYLEALQSALDDEHRAFTAKHFAQLLIDLGEMDDAVRVLKGAIQYALSDEAKIELKYTLCQAWMQQLSVPYDLELLDQLKNTLWEVWQNYKKQERPLEEAMTLTDAGIIANYSESWAESLGYFNQAISIFDREQQPDLAANAHFRKGSLLFTWAKNGNPQFYRAAAESFQEAAKVFTKANAREIYAEIQHYLGIIYSEIPDEVKKKSIWAAVSSSAFQEALQVFSKAHYPYEYATVCNHYGNALTKYPEAKLSDNIEKALYYYQEALSIRQAQDFPLERSLTLLNYLEAHWSLGMPEDQYDEQRQQHMVEAAEEIMTISPDPQLILLAKEHLNKLAQLKLAYDD